MPPGLEPYFQSWLQELTQQSNQSQAVYDLLGLCATAMGPLTMPTSKRLAPNSLGRQVAHIRRRARSWGFILGDGGPISGYVFSHPRLRELYLEKLLSESERTEFQQRFVCDGQAWYGKRAGPPAVYLRQFWIAHLMESGEWGWPGES